MIVILLLLALKSLLVAAVALGLLRLTRARSAAERSTIAHLSLFALVALPLGSLALPSLALPVPVAIARLAPVDPATKTQLPASTASADPATPLLRRKAMRSEASAVSATIARTARYAFLLPTAILLVVTLIALLRLAGLRRRAEVLVDPEWLNALARAQRRMGFKNGTALLWSDELGSPVSWGLVRPVILLNNAAVAAPEQAEAIIAHELAHVVHLDWVKLILARVVTAAFWFNPLAWVLAREAHQLREEAADDAVLAADIAGPDYAELLIGVARHQCRAALLGAHGVAPSKSSLGRRVRRVLDQNPARGPSGRLWVAGFATGMLSMAVPLAAVTLVPTHNAITTAAPMQPVERPAVVSTAEHGPPAAALAGATLPQARTPEAALVSAPAAAAVPHGDQSDQAHLPSISTDYRSAMAEAGFPGLSTDDLNDARAAGVSPEYARAMRATGMRLGIEDVIDARATNLSPAYISGLRRLGVNGSLDDYQSMEAVGVTVEFVGQLRRRGISTTSPEELVDLKAAGRFTDPEP